MDNSLTQGIQVELQEVLDSREFRKFKQAELLNRFACPIISFTLAIAGPVKVFPLSIRAFDSGVSLIKDGCSRNKIQILHFEELHENTGYEAFFAVQGCEYDIKRIMIDIEESHPIGRLLDIDVISPSGVKISRTDLGKRERCCILCTETASVCARSRAHPLEEVVTRQHGILWGTTKGLCPLDPYKGISSP